jgi:cation-transporting ATPase 13A1
LKSTPILEAFFTHYRAYSSPSRGPIDLEAKYEPNLLNTAVFLLGLSQQVSTFALNYQGRPFRESIRENPALYWGLIGASAVAFSGATDFMPELNRWLQVVEMTTDVRLVSLARLHQSDRSRALVSSVQN